MTERIKKAIDIFLDAINEGTLAKGECGKCAVGNLCGGDISWNARFMTSYGFQQRNHAETILPQRAAKIVYEMADAAIAKTDFTCEELAKIEYAFETNSKISILDYHNHTKDEIRADQIRGLEAVVKVMLEFDDCKEEVTEVFTKRADLIPV